MSLGTCSSLSSLSSGSAWTCTGSHCQRAWNLSFVAPRPCEHDDGMLTSQMPRRRFVLEPRSMLERITDFLSHPDLIFG